MKGIKPDRTQVQKEVDRNYEFFKAELKKILSVKVGKYALLKNAAIVEYFDTSSDAQKYAEAVFEDGLYSIQKVEDTILELGLIGAQYA